MKIENKRETIQYLVVVFLPTSICWGTLAILGIPAKENGFSLAAYMLGGLTPTIAALFLPFMAGRRERGTYFKRYFTFKIPVKWYLIPAAAVLFMVFIPYIIIRLFYADVAEGLVIRPLYMVLPLFAGMIIGGGLEELGWRGILVHNLRKTNPVLISVVIGLVWSLWHVPLFFITDVLQYHANFVPFMLTVIAFSFMTTALYLKSGSVLPCVFFHALVNAFGNLGFWYGGAPFAAYITESIIKLAIAVVIFSILIVEKRSPKPIPAS